MLAIRMQRVGRKKLAQYRLIVQDSHRQPTSGKVVANLGSYNPHTKVAVLKVGDIERYLSNGAQPSERAVRLLAFNKVKLPKWVKQPTNKKAREIRNPDKLRKNQPAEEVTAEPEVAEAVVEEAPAEAEVAETPAEAPAPAEEPKAEGTPAEAEAPETEPEAEKSAE